MKKEIKNNSFVFYATNLEVVEALEQTNPELANDFLKAIVEYGIYGEYKKGNPMIDALMIQTGFGIDKAKDRYAAAIENGKKGGAPKKIDDNRVLELKNQGMTNKQIAKELNCSVSSIEKINAKNRKNRKNLNDNDNDNDNDNENENVNENEKINANEKMISLFAKSNFTFEDEAEKEYFEFIKQNNIENGMSHTTAEADAWKMILGEREYIARQSANADSAK